MADSTRHLPPRESFDEVGQIALAPMGSLESDSTEIGLESSEARGTRRGE